MKKTTKKVAKKVTKKPVKGHEIDTKSSKSPYSAKEMLAVHKLVDTVLSAPANVEPEELKGMVLTVHENPKNKEVQVLGGIRNISKANVLKIVLEVLDMSAMDAAILLAQLANMQKGKKK